jgi:hypothetical protein
MKEKLSGKVFKKITPIYELTWYIKWLLSIFILCGMALISAGGYPLLQLSISLIGVIGWGIVGMIWQDRALIFINSIAVFIYTTGILKFLITSEVL